MRLLQALSKYKLPETNRQHMVLSAACFRKLSKAGFGSIVPGPDSV